MPKANDGKYVTLFPGDPGYQENKRYPWQGVYESLGMKPPQQPLRVDGFYLLDRRFEQPMAIFKNCMVSTAPGYKPPLADVPVPFSSAREAWMARNQMHLSTDAEHLVEICALVHDPGIGMPKPDCLVFDKKDFFKS